MSIGSSAGAGGGNILKVDTEMLSQLGSQLETSASALPEAPAPFNVTGGDAISQAIAAKLPALEAPIIEGLPAVKEAAGQTASNIVTAADLYDSTDERLAAEAEKHRFEGSGSSAGSSGSGAGGGGAGSSGAAGSAGSAGAGGTGGAGGNPMGQMSQMMGTPMQMASQAAQMPMQAMGAVSSAPQGVMQGVQQISQMAGEKDDAKAGPSPEARRPDERSAEEQQAAGSDEHREGVPESVVGEVPQANSGAPDQRPAGPRHAASDPAIDV